MLYTTLVLQHMLVSFGQTTDFIFFSGNVMRYAYLVYYCSLIIGSELNI